MAQADCLRTLVRDPCPDGRARAPKIWQASRQWSSQITQEAPVDPYSVASWRMSAMPQDGQRRSLYWGLGCPDHHGRG